MEEAIKSAVAVKLVTESTADALDNVNNRQNGRTPGVTPTPTPLPPNPGQVCPPPYINSFAPVIGNTGTIVQIKGRNLDTTIKVFINGTQVEPKNVQVLDPQTLKVVVPQVGTGTAVSTGNVKVDTFYGTFTTVATFKYDPAVPAGSTSSPGSVVNNASGTPPVLTSESTNPQNTTAQVALVQTQKTQSPLGGDDILVVEVAPNNGVWTISDQPKFTYSVYTFTKVNNQETEKFEEKENDGRLVNRVSQGVIYLTPDKQKFQVSRQNLITYQLDDVIKDDYPNQKLKFDIQFQLQANKADPYKVERLNYNYTLIVPGPQTTSQGELQEPGSLVLVSDTSSGGLPNFSGEEYYNIKKPAGGYLTYKFSCPGLKTKNDPVVRVAGTSTKKTIRVEESSDTKYTNVITVDGIGSLVLSVSYTSSLYEINGRPLAASAQINFTL